MSFITQFYGNLREFHIGSDYFCLVDAIHLLFDRGPPLSNRTTTRIAWMTINVLSTLQVLHVMIQCTRSIASDSEDVDEFMKIFNQTFILTTAFCRNWCFTYHRQTLLQLKHFINSKKCQRNDPAAFALREKTFRRNIKWMAIFQCVATFNCIGWIATEFWYVESLQIPYLLEYLPKKLALFMKLFHAIIYLSWSVLSFVSLTQFGTILNSLHTELKIIVGQFKNIFAEVASTHDQLNNYQSDEFWMELNCTFKEALEHHSEYIRIYDKLKTISSINFLILFASAAIIITTNTLIFIFDPSLARLPLQMVGIQSMLETYLCCNLITILEIENKRIVEYVYGIDWLAAKRRTTQKQRKIGSEIRQNVIMLQLQVHKGLSIRAGGMFAVDLETFSELMKLVYSLLTFVRRQQAFSQE